MARKRPGIRAATAAFVLVLVVTVGIAGLAVISLPKSQNSQTQLGMASTTRTSAGLGTVSSSGSIGGIPIATSASNSQQTNTVTSTLSSYSCPSLPGASYSSSNMTYTVPSCTSYSFPGPTAQIEVLNSSQVFPFVKGAYYFDVAFVKGDYTSKTDFILNVTGRLLVTGNWSTGYNVSFVGNELLNITVQKTQQSSHVVTSVLVNHLPDRNSSLTFTQQQKAIIQVALSNSTVTGFMTDPPYYVALVYPEGGGPLNGTNVVELLQVNGIRAIAAWVNEGTTAVVSANDGSRASVECDGNGLCVTDPWGVKPDAGVSMPPFVLMIAYPGSWSASVTAYNNAVPSSKYLLYTKTFTGVGNENITIPWQSDLNGMTVTATLQKSDGGSATLTGTMNWTGGEDPDIESTNSNSTSVTVSSSVG